MNEPGLSLDQAPPLTVPLRFFLSAPLFSLAASLVLLWQGPLLLAGRWQPALLGTVHLLTLGHMGMVMLGAMLQMLPVVAGTPVRRPVLVAGLVHSLAAPGVMLLAAGLIFSFRPALMLALPVLGAGILGFAAIVLATLRDAAPGNRTAAAMRLAVLMLAATVTLGLLLLSNHVFGWWVSQREVATDVHLGWGLLGWTGILVVGVAFQVVPMFQLTPSYPRSLTRWLAPLLFAVLLVGALPFSQLHTVSGVVLAAGFSAFAVMTLVLQTRRRRKLPDTTASFWRIAMASLLGAAALWLAGRLVPGLAAPESHGLLLGVLMIVGFAMSAMNGMLYKIVPFLVWFPLQAKRGPTGPPVPNVKAILPDRHARGQMWLHLAALLLLLAAILEPALLSRPAAVLFAASNLALWVNLLTPFRVYRRLNAQVGGTG